MGEEARKNFATWVDEGFYENYLSGEKVLDIGYSGYLHDVRPITPSAIGIGLDYPGYDGRTLPFDSNSQDAVFASHCLEHIDDYRASLADWFRVLKVGGFMIVAVPHQYLYERNLRLPSRFNLDHKRLYTPASLMLEVEEALDPLCYRVRLLQDNDEGFDYDIPPEQHAVGSYEILLVLEKIARPAWADAMQGPPAIRNLQLGAFVPFPRPEDQSPVFAIQSSPPPQTIIAFKMDHVGDFVMAKPALYSLRRAFPTAQITLVCGDWNKNSAEELDIFDEVIGFSLFERNAALNAAVPMEVRITKLQQLLAGRRFDLAIDLRVDDDTRVALKHVEADVRAGVGYPQDFKYLDIALPMLSPTTSGRSGIYNFGASYFTARCGENRGYEIEIPAGMYESGFNLVWGPYQSLLPSRYHIRLLLKDEAGLIPPFNFDIVYDGGRRKLAEGSCEEIASSGIWLDIREPVEDFELRLWGRGNPSKDALFRGCSIEKEGTMEKKHQSEIMAMLIALVEQRMRFAPVEGSIG